MREFKPHQHLQRTDTEEYKVNVIFFLPSGYEFSDDVKPEKDNGNYILVFEIKSVDFDTQPQEIRRTYKITESSGFDVTTTVKVDDSVKGKVTNSSGDADAS